MVEIVLEFFVLLFSAASKKLLFDLPVDVNTVLLKLPLGYFQILDQKFQSNVVLV